MEVITTHVNADFDAFGSMLAAKKLYPNAVVAFPGSQEKSLRDFFMESTLYILSIERAQDIDLSQVERLILVDTRQKSRIGRFARLLEDENVEIHVWDHHPDSDEDARGDKEVIRHVGATVTLLCQEIRQRQMVINAEEATVLALGVYEDTGSFTFSSTTPHDLETAAWLLECGANLNIVADMMTAELSRDQVAVLHQLIEEAETIEIGGLDIIVATAGAEGYVGDLAVLVHQYRDMENPDALFALVRMQDRVYLIARSRSDEVNAGDIAGEFGGGGHATAASATIRDQPLYEAKETLVGLIRRRVHPKREAGQIMSWPVITVSADQSVQTAAEYLARYQVSSLPVMRGPSVVGAVHRQALEKALHHGLAEASVAEYMNPDVVTVSPRSSIESVLDTTMEHRHRLVLVMDDNLLAGVISRSDLLEHMKLPSRRDSANADEFPSGRLRAKNIRRIMEEMLPDRVLEMLRRAGQVAEARHEAVYLVGGTVRDLLLRKTNLDIDLVVEGDGIAFARAMTQEFSSCRIRGHVKFGTAKLMFDDGLTFDVATARHEYYDRPGALPTVETSSIKRDLFRRDFTMNTLAVELTARNFGSLLDFFGGSRDVKDRIIRVLHNLAFVEDPTRILRAVRFSTRFGFLIGKHTLTLLKAAIRMKVFDRVEGRRLLNELIHILQERNPLPALRMMSELGIYETLHPDLKYTSTTEDLLESVAEVLSWWRYLFLPDSVEPWIVYLRALCDGQDDEGWERILKRFSVAPSRIEALTRENKQMKTALSAFGRGSIEKPSQALEILNGMSLEMLLFMMGRTTREPTRKAVSDYITSWRYIQPELSGQDLIALGYRPGPQFKTMLQTLRKARIDGGVVDADGERDLLRTLFPRGEMADT